MKTTEEKRIEFRTRLNGTEIIKVPGAFNAICSRFVEAHGFEAAYVSGSATSGGAHALPDIGLVTLQDMVRQVQRVSKVVDIPTICDGDTGYGGAEQMPHTVRAFEAHGATAIHFEDQVFPKRCGHVKGKELLPAEEFAEKIKRAVSGKRDNNTIIIARCDAFMVTGMEDTINRLKLYRDAGADVVFPEALSSLKDYERIVKEIGLPVLANMTEFGNTPYFTDKEFESAGCKIVLYPVTLLRYAMGAINRALTSLKENGNQEELVKDMYTRQEFYDLIEYDPMKEFERKY